MSTMDIDIFQSTHPVRGATTAFDQGTALVHISIHAPREGCDRFAALPSRHLDVFQSTHPVRGATIHPMHAAHTTLQFQSTHPVRGATLPDGIYRQRLIFQSTHPVRGATRIGGRDRPAHPQFQSTHPVRGATSLNTSAISLSDFNPRTP